MNWCLCGRGEGQTAVLGTLLRYLPIAIYDPIFARVAGKRRRMGDAVAES
ncbi:MAG: hypothetical protein M1492_05220 [Gammaproteobacteria bacterium]|nr:hypothetical protein [Gammaproteobacteria bacterium]